jgi:hypothetical protein
MSPPQLGADADREGGATAAAARALQCRSGPPPLTLNAAEFISAEIGEPHLWSRHSSRVMDERCCPKRRKDGSGLGTTTPVVGAAWLPMEMATATLDFQGRKMRENGKREDAGGRAGCPRGSARDLAEGAAQSRVRDNHGYVKAAAIEA